MIIVATVVQMDDVLAELGPKENKGSPAGLIQPACLVGEGEVTAVSKAYIVRLLTIVLICSAYVSEHQKAMLLVIDAEKSLAKDATMANFSQGLIPS